MRRFAIAAERTDGARVTFDAEETRHLARVLRLGPGDTVIATDGAGHAYLVRVDAVSDTATGTIVGPAPGVAESPLAITLLQGVPKADKMETIVRATTELGVARICPVVTDRTIVRLEASRWRDRARRWQRVAKEAAKQCGRATVPDVAVARPLVETLDTLPAPTPTELRLCLWEGDAPPLVSVLDETKRASATVLVGPEGGLARAEVDAARAHGFVVASLGQRILRTETAAPTIVALLQFRLGDLGTRSAQRDVDVAERRT